MGRRLRSPQYQARQVTQTAAAAAFWLSSGYLRALGFSLLVAFSAAGLVVMNPANEFAWTVGGAFASLLAGVGGVAIAEWKAMKPQPPVLVGAHQLWELSLPDLEHLAVSALQADGLAVLADPLALPGAARYRASSISGTAYVLVLPGPEVASADLEPLAAQVAGYLGSTGLAITAGVFVDGVDAWAARHHIRLIDGDGFADLINGGRL